MIKFFRNHIYQEIADQFDLGKILEIERFTGGLAAPKVSVITPRGRFVIAKYTLGDGSIFKNKSKVSLAKEIELLIALKGLQVPHYLSDQSDNCILERDGFGITVYKHLPGEHITDLNEKQVFQLGLFLGAFHSQGAQLKADFSGRKIFYDFSPEQFEKKKLYAYKQTNKILKSVVPEIEKGVLSNMLDKSLPQGPIHVDIKTDNLLFAGNKLTGVIDFGNFYNGPYILDLGKAIVFNCTKEGFIDKKLMNSMLRGYNKSRKLNKQEMRSLNQAMRYGIYSHIWLDLYHVPLKLVPVSHTLYFVENFLPAVR